MLRRFFCQRAFFSSGALLFSSRAGKASETPWVRQVVSGPDLLRNPRYSKGFAFDNEERDRLHLR